MDLLTYDSRDPSFKTPYGAVPAGTAVTFTLRPPMASGFSRGVLLARLEFRDNQLLELPMPWVGRQGDRDAFSAQLDTGDYVGLIWYSFRLEGLDGRSLDFPTYQLTVYDGAEAPPDWFGQGLTYQIFPDRFRRSRIPDPAGVVGGRWVHQDWADDPAYRPDERGEIRNRDFFGGDLRGVMEKLPYLKDLGVETLYFNPIFEGAENHRYGTGDYEKIDPFLGNTEDFSALCAAAHALGIRVILDGVFNHTGFVSKYFNGDGSYPGPGAAQSQDSPYSSWYRFSHWPDQYDAWWGIYSLPAVNESDPGYWDYIITGENSILRRWLRAGADGWRLDVADELPDSFIHAVHQAVRQTKPDAVVIGEVWEDGTTKVAYDVRRRHLLGGHLDGLMNYPFRSALLSYLLGGDAARFKESMETLRENYPPFAWTGGMNFLGTHDTPRIFTLLGAGRDCLDQSKDWRAAYRMTAEERSLGLARLKAGATLLYAFPGSPTLYYGDEAGMEGFEDPFNRRPYPWGQEDPDLLAHFKALGQARKTWPALRKGDLHYVAAKGHLLAFTRTWEGETVLAAANLSKQTKHVTVEGRSFRLPPMSAQLTRIEREGNL